jgi:hypothetical protein
MTRRDAHRVASIALRRIGWLALVALPFVLAACNPSGTSTY